MVSTVDRLFKLKQTALLLSSGIFAYLISCGGVPDWHTLATLASAILLTVSGATAMNMGLDRDIDGLMERTRNRPILAKKVSPAAAAALSVALLAGGLYLSYTINAYVQAAGLLGIVAYVAAYTCLLKRRTSASVLIGGVAGGCPAAGGYMAHPAADALA